MELFEAIHGRLTIGKVKPEPLPRDVIEKLLSAGAQAPNHHKVRPWRFVVLTGDGRKKLGDVMAASFLDRNPATPPEGLNKPRSLSLRAPLLIAVGADKPAADSKTIEVENLSAASAACQNILLAAHALGLGAMWRTGEWARDARVKEFLGFSTDQHIVGFIYVGYPEVTPEPYTRIGFEDRTVWME
ncbi:MAG TPA: nitroreductase [Anaerolineales bacterium]|nr:nitroreductase [Anaerolineales bacterium]HMX19036.1 nitroreductase [Anaerolineales bacterium]HNE67283.1 nitroreductase [Anaerolineales bacterium]HNH03634.1 nitroreductase [Anaerolineales bacterium]